MTTQQLKNSILQMAVSGKLVPQDPNDEPASVLLERIKAEKSQLVKEGKIKKDKKSSEIFRGASRNIPYAFCEQIGKEIRDISDEIPFDIPESWEWARIQDIFQIEMGQSPDGNSVFEGVNGIEFHQGKIYFSDRIILKSNQVTSNPKKVAEPYSILLCVRAPVGKVNITDRRLCIGRGLCALKPYNIFNLYFSYLVLQSLEENFIKQATGTTFKAITAEVVKSQLIPVPPLSEQHRIVAKMEELLPYIEKYKQAETQLTKLNSDFPELLKKSILQEAVQGKLVPQDPNDEPASVLLERIRAEKQTLIKTGKIKKDKHESVIVTSDKIPYKLPDSWVWCRLNDLVIKEIKRGKSPIYTEKGSTLVFAQKCNVKNGGINLALAKFLDELTANKYPKEEYMQDGDIIINSTGTGTLGRVGIFKKSDNPENVPVVPDSHVTIVRTYRGLSLYLYYVLKNYQPLLEENGEGSTKQKELKADKIKELLIPLSPIEEQHRIAAQIDKLIPIINTIPR